MSTATSSRSNVRQLRTSVVARTEQRRAAATQQRDQQRTQHRQQLLMKRRRLPEPPPPSAASATSAAAASASATGVKLPAAVATATTSTGSSNNRALTRRQRLEIFRSNKRQQELAERRKKMSCPPFRAGCSTLSFSVFDATKVGTATADSHRAVRKPTVATANGVKSRVVTRSMTAAAAAAASTATAQSTAATAVTSKKKTIAPQLCSIAELSESNSGTPAATAAQDTATAAAANTPIGPVCPSETPAVVGDAVTQPLSVGHFRRLVSDEERRLLAAADWWDQLQLSAPVPAGCQGEVRSVQGQARLLVRERFGQFGGLIDQCASGSQAGEAAGRPTTLTDLQGFWDMVMLQVDDVDAKLANLRALYESGWSAESLAGSSRCPATAAGTAATANGPLAKPTRRLKPKPELTNKARPAARSNLRAFIAASRKKLDTDGAAAAGATTACHSPAQALQREPLAVLDEQTRANFAAAAADNGQTVAMTAAASNSSSAPPAAAAAAPAAVATPVKTFSAGFFSIESPPVGEHVVSASLRRCRDADTRRLSQLSSVQKRQQQQQRRSDAQSPAPGQLRRPLCDLSPLVNVARWAKRVTASPLISAAAAGASPVLFPPAAAAGGVGGGGARETGDWCGGAERDRASCQPALGQLSHAQLPTVVNDTAAAAASSKKAAAAPATPRMNTGRARRSSRPLASLMDSPMFNSTALL